jgi:hypothetical protein
MNNCECDSCRRSESNNPYYFLNFSTLSQSFSITGSAANLLGSAILPSAVRVATLDLKSNAGLIALSLASTITNFTLGANCAVYAALDQGAVVSIDSLTRHFVCHLSGANSAAGLPSSSARTTLVPMGQNTNYKINSGQFLAIYVSAPNDVTALIAGVLTAFWIPAQ